MIFYMDIDIIGLRISSRKADKYYPYGHERWELIFSQLLSIILILTAGGILYQSFKGITTGATPIPGKVALFTAIFSIVTKEIMYQYTMRIAKKIGSVAMEADAWHHRSDAFSSIATFIGILGARFGWTFLDPIAGILVGMMIIKVGVEIYRSSIEGLVDESADKETIEKIRDIALKTPMVLQVSELKTRQFANKIYIDMNICVDHFKTVIEGHDIATAVHDRIEEKMPEVAHVMVHVEPTQITGACLSGNFNNFKKK